MILRSSQKMSNTPICDIVYNILRVFVQWWRIWEHPVILIMNILCPNTHRWEHQTNRTLRKLLINLLVAHKPPTSACSIQPCFQWSIYRTRKIMYHLYLRMRMKCSGFPLHHAESMNGMKLFSNYKSRFSSEKVTFLRRGIPARISWVLFGKLTVFIMMFHTCTPANDGSFKLKIAQECFIQGATNIRAPE